MQIGRHTPDHAKHVADTGCLLAMAECEVNTKAGEDLRNKARRALKAVVAKLTFLPALDSLMQRPISEGVMRIVLEQLGKVLATDVSGRASLVSSGGLAKLQEIAEQPGSRLKDLVALVNSHFPEEIVKYNSPSYSQQLLQKLEAMSAEAITAT
jgi:hypothetical protein